MTTRSTGDAAHSVRRLAVVLSLLSAWMLISGCGDDPPRLGGADLFAMGGDATVAELGSGDRSLDESPVELATLVASGVDNRLYVLVEEPGIEYLIQARTNGSIQSVGYADTGSVLQRQLALAVGPTGGMVVAEDAGVESMLLVRDYDQSFDRQVHVALQVGAAALAEDGSMLVGSRTGTRIDAVDARDNVVGVLGPPESEAQVILDEPLGAVVSLLRLPDDRVVFVADSADGYRLYVVDDTEVHPVEAELDGQEFNPVRSSGERRTDPSHRVDRLAMTPIALGADERVLTIGIGRQGDPSIALVDIDTGDVEVLAELVGVEPSIDQPISAAAVGDDVIFLAQDQLWKLEGVL